MQYIYAGKFVNHLNRRVQKYLILWNALFELEFESFLFKNIISILNKRNYNIKTKFKTVNLLTLFLSDPQIYWYNNGQEIFH